jgi:aspartate carbamoyltransferase regulatory subunit
MNAQSSERVRKSRARRVQVIEHISDGKLQAIIKALDLMKKNHQYVIVPDVVDEMVVTSNREKRSPFLQQRDLT